MRGKHLWAEIVRFSRSEFMRSLGLQLLAATSVLMMAALLVMSVTLSNLQESRMQNEAAQDTLLEITTIESRLMDFDGAWNSYRVTGNTVFLTRITDDTNDLHASLAKLKDSLQSDPVQVQRHNEIAALVKQRDDLNRYLFDPARSDNSALAAKTSAGRQVTDDIRSLLWKVLTRERQKRSANTIAMIAQAQNSFRIAVGIVCLTLFFGAICLLLSLSPRKT